MVDIVQRIRNIKDQIEQKGKPPQDVATNLLQWFKIELTYSSNSIEGNTLSRMETAAVIQDGITVGGKLLREHLEATNHANAYEFILSLSRNSSVTEADVLSLHGKVLKSIDDENAGKYRNIPVRVVGSSVVFPNYLKVPTLMSKLIQDINSQDDVLKKAIKCHYDLVTIHPFTDGNGRTARLLMNLILIQGGYLPGVVKPKDRLKYLTALEKAQLGGSRDDFNNLLLLGIEKSLIIYLKALKGEDSTLGISNTNLVKIGELARNAEENISTIRYWIKIGLLEASETLRSGYQLFDHREVGKCKRIRELQNQRYSLKEILKIIEEEFV